VEGRIARIAVAIALLFSVRASAQPFFSKGNVVVTVEGCGIRGGTCTGLLNGTGTNNSYGDNQAAPLSLFQYTPNGTASVMFVNSLVLPQTGSGANLPVSSEYGSSSEGTLQLSGAGQYLTIMGYGINAATFDANPVVYGAAPSDALAQSGSLTGESYTPVARVVALIDANGNVNSSTALYNIFNTNNPRSIFTADGVTSAYVSGQGSGSDATGGVFLTPLFAPNSAPTAITGLDTSSNTLSQDTRDVQMVNNTLYISVDTKEGSGDARSYIGTLGSPPATGLYSSGAGPTMISGYGNSGGTGKETITANPNSNGNGPNAGMQINLSPVGYFFANAATLYVADSGNPKNNSATSSLGNGGLQKWINSKSNGSGTWSLAYTLYQGLNLMPNSSPSGSTGLYGLTGVVVGSNVLLYATNYTILDLDQTYLYGVTDTLSFTTPAEASGEMFTVLDTAPADSNFKGVAFAPTIPTGGVEITTSPSGLSFSSSAGCAAGTYPAPQLLIWTPTTTCSLSVVSPQSGGPGVQYAFAEWQDGTTSTTDTVIAPSTPAIYTASFNTQYQLTTAAGTGGSVSPGGFFNAGTDATITATPSAGYYFTGFTGTTSSTSNPFVLLMNAPQSITANFAPQTTPTITWNPPAAINFGSALSSTQLNATASVPGMFAYNPPAGTVLSPGSGQTLSVTFTPTNAILYTTATDTTTITVNPAGSSSPASLVVTSLLTRSGSSVTVQITIANTGGTAAANVMLNNTKVGADAGTPLPQSIGSIGPGQTAQATVTVPASVGASGAPSSLTISGTYTGGSFSSSARITLP
jgi:hypothetical protein